MSELEELQKTIAELREKLEKIPVYNSAKIDALYTRIQALEDKIASVEPEPKKDRGRPKKEKAETAEPKKEPKEVKQIDFTEEEEPWWTRV